MSSMRHQTAITTGFLTLLIATSSAVAVEIQQRPLTSSVLAQPTLSAASPSSQATRPSINPAWDTVQQLDSLQALVARLQGQLEEQQRALEQLQKDQRARYQDLDQRVLALAERSQTASPSVVASAPAAPQTGYRNRVDPNLSEADIERHKQLFIAAYQRYIDQGAQPAITAMQAFVEAHPTSLFAASGFFWLGEFHLALSPANRTAAMAHFQRVITDYDTDPKVPGAYLKLVELHTQANQPTEAARWRSELLTRFPNSPEAARLPADPPAVPSATSSPGML